MFDKINLTLKSIHKYTSHLPLAAILSVCGEDNLKN